MTRPRICLDRLLPRDLARPHVTLPGAPNRAIAAVNRQWPNGSTLTAAFIGGTEAQRAAVRSAAAEWQSRCNVKWEFRASLPATIRVAFDPNDGAWSYIGTDCAAIPANQPTTNIGWDDDPGMVRHELGHSLSLCHEHQNPKGGIKWDVEAVVADLSGPPNYWDRETIISNVIEKYTLDQIIGTEFDRLSIMLYSFPASWTIDGFSAQWNQQISATDGAFVQSAKMYPFSAVLLPKLPVFATTAGVIAARGEVDEYSIEMETAGVLNVTTFGGLDLVASLYSGAKMVAQDDDSGAGKNPLIVASLQPGTYRLAIRHYSTTGTGAYKVLAWRS